MRNPDPGSDFESFSRHIAGIDDETAVQRLLQQGYDGITYLGDACGQVVGDLFFQTHSSGQEMHVFACRVNFTHRRCGIGTMLVQRFLEHAWSNNVRTVRISKGNDAMMRILHKIISGEVPLPAFTLAPIGSEPGYARLA